MNNKNLILVLSATTNKTGNLSEEGKRRVEFAADRFKQGLTDILLMSGRQYFKELLDSRETHAGSMESYACKLGIAPTHILKEEYSIETVAQPLFSDVLYLIDLKPNKIQVISSDYHQRRVETICSLIFGDRYIFTFEGIESGLMEDRQTLEKEKDSLEAFKNTFRGVKKGDIEAAFVTLFRNHHIYSRLVEAMEELKKEYPQRDYTKILNIMKDYSTRGKETDFNKVHSVLQDYLRLIEKIEYKFNINICK